MQIASFYCQALVSAILSYATGAAPCAGTWPCKPFCWTASSLHILSVDVGFLRISWLQVSLVLPSVQDAFGPGGTYLAFAAIGVVAVSTILAIVPETKGKTLEEIEALFDGKAD